METIQAGSWEELQGALRDLRKEVASKLAELHPFVPSPLVFRGQGDTSWSLETTLERTGKSPMRMDEYYRYALKVRPQIEAFTERQWNLPTMEDFQKEAYSRENPFFVRQPAYEYLAFLRHHGFPSPLLDWTRSPYVAIYFAFRHAMKEGSKAAIHVYLGSYRGGRSWSSGDSMIQLLGPYVRSHSRHFLQQCQYTICFEAGDQLATYVPHSIVLDSPREDQDLHWVIEAPTSLRPEILRELDLMNINGYSLFSSDDALIETMAAREFIFT